jgi:hypothetical protein
MRVVMRKRWRWMFLGITVLATAAVVYAVLRPSPYAFLDRFHPRRMKVDNSRYGWPFVKPPSGSHYSVLVFKNEDAPRVLEAVNREMSWSKGFTAGADAIVWAEDGSRWMFMPENDPDRFSDQGLVFETGREGGRSLAIFNGYGTFGSPSAAPACLVIYRHDQTWAEAAVKRVRTWLHL